MQVFRVDIDGSGLKQLTFGRGDKFSASWSPDGSRIAYTWSSPGSQWEELREIDAAGSDADSLAITFSLSGISWSPDSRRLAFSALDDYGLWLFFVRLDGSRARRAFRFPPAEISWSPDGKKIAYATKRGVSLLDIATGRRSRIVRAKRTDKGFYSLDWQPRHS